jgi:glycosyltransferase 2 family protein
MNRCGADASAGSQGDAGGGPAAAATPAGRARGARRAVRLARYALAAVPLAWILGRMDPEQFLRAATVAAWWTLPFVVAVQYGGMLLQAVRWWLAQKALEPCVSWRASLSQHFVASAYAVVLPGSFAQDLLRSAMAARRLDPGVSWGAAWVTRITGLVAWILLALVGIALVDRSLLPPRTLGLAAVSLAATLALVVISFSKRATRPIRRLLAPALRGKWLAWAERIREAVYRYRHRRGFLLGLVLLAILVELFLILGGAITIYGICGAWTLVDLLAFIPLIEILLVVLPVTPGGLGVREALLTALFARLGLTAEQTGVYVVLALLGVPLRAVGGLPFLLRAGWRRRRPEGAREQDSHAGNDDGAGTGPKAPPAAP